MLYQNDGGYRVSMRSLSDDVDVAAIASHFGGGGHPRAAGCTVAGGPAERDLFLTPGCRTSQSGVMARRQGQPSLHGMLIIDKPAHWTSHDVVAWARRWTGERKIGHAGTLDPAATGVLPLAVGDATRVLEYLDEADKAYRAEITFGVATDSADLDGAVIAIDDVKVSSELIQDALPEFVGDIEQIPPALSAIRIDGVRAYDLARQGENIEMPLRRVSIRSIDVDQPGRQHADCRHRLLKGDVHPLARARPRESD